ncbi:hypothetical protein [Nocardia sp. NPDC059228]|uniref:hypothetical protein n=1 Tax=Nocardia sp. NPDC059228 TaxID=3346777 RepID=UPI003683029B
MSSASDHIRTDEAAMADHTGTDVIDLLRAAQADIARTLNHQAAGETIQAISKEDGACKVAGGAWSLVHRQLRGDLRRQEGRWPMYTVAGLLVGNGLVQCPASHTPEGVHHARLLGLTTASWLLAIDLV